MAPRDAHAVQPRSQSGSAAHRFGCLPGRPDPKTGGVPLCGLSRVPTTRSLLFPDVVVIVVVVGITFVLARTGTPPLDAVLFAAGAGLAGVVTVRVATSRVLTRLVRSTVTALHHAHSQV